MEDEENMQRLMDAFDAQGFVKLDPDEESTQWAARARARAEASLRSATPKDGWFDDVLGEALPRHEELLALLDVLLAKKPEIPRSAQLSTLVRGFARDANHRHVDGYYAPDPKEPDTKVFAWHALIIGIPLVDLPEHEEAGNPVVWPGSHRLTRRALESLPRPVTREDVGRTIETISLLSERMESLRLHGQAGTIFVMDHDLHHGMLPHRKENFDRHVAYYRIPERSFDQPDSVLNHNELFRRR